MQKFQITPEVYRLMFRDLKNKMNHRERVYKMCDLMRKWVNGEGTENYDQLFDLFAPEHFLGICSEEIRETIWDVSLGFVQEVADLVYFYVQNQSVQ